MRKVALVGAAAWLLAAAGQLHAQPVVDGALAGDESFYGAVLWTQNQPTSAGDNAPGSMTTCPGAVGFKLDAGMGADFLLSFGGDGNGFFPNFLSMPTLGGGQGEFLGTGTYGATPFISENAVFPGIQIAIDNSNVGGVTDADVTEAGSATTGMEIVIPLDLIGNPAPGSVKITAFVNSGDHGYSSNQYLPGLPPGTGNLETTRNVDLSAQAGDQFATVAGSPTGAIVTDGVLDAGYGAELALQTNGTQFGDNANPDVALASGSELNGLYAVMDAGNLYIMLTGNLETNHNKLELFIDSIPGEGQQEFRADNASIDFGNVNNNMGASSGASFTAPHVDFANGSEINGVYAHVDEANGFLHLLVTGNIQSSCVSSSDMDASNAVPKMHLFIDADENDGQNTLLLNNPNVSFDNFVLSMAGLTFDAGFAPDYWLAVHTEFVPTVVRAMDALVLRSGGKIFQDYGTYDKAVERPISFDGPDFDIYDSFAADPLIARYPPRGIVEALFAWEAADPIRDLDFDVVDKAMLENDNGTNHLEPIVGRVVFDLDNSNTAGVTDVSAAGAASATTGWEVKLSLDEIGWDGVSPIKVSGFITNPNFSQIFNQVIGGLPGPADVGTTAMTDFNAFAGEQFVTVYTPGAQCACETDGNSAQVDVFDLLAYLDNWFANNAAADIDGTPGVDVFDLLAFLDCWFPASAGNPCP